MNRYGGVSVTGPYLVNFADICELFIMKKAKKKILQI